jgi:chitin disaccharide deacetylase
MNQINNIHFTASMHDSVIKIADDFGIDDEHDAVMIGLLKKNKIDGVSVFSEFIQASCAQNIAKVRSENNVQIGLHFNLTHGDSCIDVSSLLSNAIFRKIDKIKILNSLNHQLQAFEEKFGFMPDFIDGHQHVHTFPIISKVIIQTLERIQFTGWVRNIGSGSLTGLHLAWKYSFFKKFLVLEVLSFFHRRDLKKSALSFNKFFFGLLPLEQPKKLSIALSSLYSLDFSTSTIIMCHPGSLDGSESIDHPAKSRDLEASFLLAN